VVVTHSGVILAPELAQVAADEIVHGRRDRGFERYTPRSSG
jgi:hypothetical protein